MKKTYEFAAFIAVVLMVWVPLVTYASRSSDRDSGSGSKDKTPPSILSISISSSNTTPSVAAPGDTVTIAFTTSEKVTWPIVLVNSRVLLIIAKNSSGNMWQATYTVQDKDREGPVKYLITLADPSKNVYICSNVKLSYIKYCPPTDDSSVTVTKEVAPPADTVAPVIAPTADMTIETASQSTATVAYTLPTATDDVDGSVPVTCSPASGSAFPLGTTTVSCTATDAAGNQSTSSFAIGVVFKDMVAPIFAPYQDFTLVTLGSEAAVDYALPTATDDIDGAVPVICAPAPGSIFPLGVNTVTCTATDSAGNTASLGFSVIVNNPPPPVPVVIASQSDESFLCAPDWRNCFTGGDLRTVIPLGKGSDLIQGLETTITSITTAKDETSFFVNQPWLVYIDCYMDAAYTQLCPDWLAATPGNGMQHYSLWNYATSTTDNKHWTAYFSDPLRDRNFDNTAPIRINPNYYYRIAIDDNGWAIGAYGSESLMQPYFVINGLASLP